MEESEGGEQQSSLDGGGVSIVQQAEVIETGLTNVFESDGGNSFSLQQLADMGFLVPVADPSTLRAAYAFRQKVMASILDPEHDFLYTVSYEERGRSIERTTSSYAEAKKLCEVYRVAYKANPKKSGVLKLAAAFGIEARIVEQRGLPYDTEATSAWVLYEVRHAKTGKTEQGQGFADINERPGRTMPKHHAIALADTRAYSRAVLRLAGFGEVGAEEIVAPEIDLPQIVQDTPPPREVTRLRASNNAGTIYDHGVETRPAQAEVVQRETKAEVTQAAASTTMSALISHSAATVAKAATPAPAPANAIGSDVITEAQVKKLSQMLLQKLGTREAAVAWLRENANVATTRDVREADYPRVLASVNAIEVQT